MSVTHSLSLHPLSLLLSISIHSLSLPPSLISATAESANTTLSSRGYLTKQTSPLRAYNSGLRGFGVDYIGFVPLICATAMTRSLATVEVNAGRKHPQLHADADIYINHNNHTDWRTEKNKAFMMTFQRGSRTRRIRRYRKSRNFVMDFS